MKVNLTPSELIDQLRAWFFPKDRSIYLAGNCSIFLPGSYELGLARIAETTLTANVASVTFNNIPQSFRSLLIISQTLTDRVAEGDNVTWQANGDSGAFYDHQFIRAIDTSVSGDGLRAQTIGILASTEAASSRANNFAPGVTVFPGYSLTDREKWSVMLGGGMFGNVSADADMTIFNFISRWRNTAAISSLTLAPNFGANIVTGSIFTLYGIV